MKPKSIRKANDRIRSKFSAQFQKEGKRIKKTIDQDGLLFASLAQGFISVAGVIQKRPYKPGDTIAILYLDFPGSKTKAGFYQLEIAIEDNNILSFGIVRDMKGKEVSKAVINQSPPVPDPGIEREFTIESLDWLDKNHVKVDGKVKIGEKWREYDVVVLL